MIVTADWVLPVCDPPIRNGAVAVVAGVIADVGTLADVAARRPDDHEVVELPGRIIAPGLVNAHTHLALSVLEGLAPPAPLAEWLGGVAPSVLGLSPEEFGASSALGASHCLRTGTTVVADIVYGASSRSAAADLGVAGAYCWELLGMGADAMDDSLARRGFPLVGEHVEAEDGRTVAGLAPHAPYSAGPGLLKAAHLAARRHGAPLVIHVAESADEVEAIRDGSGPLGRTAERLAAGFSPSGATPVGYLAALGALDDAVCVHVVHVDREDAALLAGRARGAVLCPRSNAWLRNGEPPVRMLREAGVRLGLGTDSSASNDDLDLFAEARTLRALDATLTAGETLWMMTMGGAQLIGMAGSFGGLAPGAQADLVAVRADADDGPVEAFLTGAPETVSDVMAAGLWKVRDHRVCFDIEEIRETARRAREHASALTEAERGKR
jgi:5-methylthioadenosine/S-adenosylhomocysteine deaminase